MHITPFPCFPHQRHNCPTCRRAAKRERSTERYKRRERRRVKIERRILVKSFLVGAGILTVWSAFCIAVGWAANIW